MNTINYTSAKLYKIDQAEAIEILRLHNPYLSFQGFVDTSTAIPGSYIKDRAWIAINSGVIFGISGVTQGQIIVDTGSFFIAEDVNVYIGRESDSDRVSHADPKIWLANMRSVTLTSFPDVTAWDKNIFSGALEQRALEYYSGYYDRLWMLIKTNDANGSGGYYHRIMWYDYSTNPPTVSSNSYVVGLSYQSTDSHAHACMIIGEDGYIWVSGCDRTGTASNDYFRIRRSTNPENPTSFTQKYAATGTYNHSYGGIAKCKDKLIGYYRHNYYQRRIVVSGDNGENWTEYLFAESDDSDHWLYGHILRGIGHHEGAFHLISFNNHETLTGCSGGFGDAPNNYPKHALVWSDDGETWGNYEYYLTRKKGGWSKNITGSGDHLTETELMNYCALINEPYHIPNGGFGVYPHANYPVPILTANNELIFVSNIGERNLCDNGHEEMSHYLRISRYNLSTHQWDETDIGYATLGFSTNDSFRVNIAYASGLRNDTFDIIFLDKDQTPHNSYIYRFTLDGERFRSIKNISGFTVDNIVTATYTHNFWEHEGVVMAFVCDDATNPDVEMVFFDKRWLKP